jgi:hypothetical protein
VCRRNEVAADAVEAHLRGSRHAHGRQRQNRPLRIPQVPQVRVRVDAAGGQHVRVLAVPVDVGDDARVRPQRVLEHGTGLGPFEHLDELRRGDGTEGRRLAAYCELCARHLELAVAVEELQRLRVVVEVFEREMATTGEQQVLTRVVDREGCGLQVVEVHAVFGLSGDWALLLHFDIHCVVVMTMTAVVVVVGGGRLWASSEINL